MAEQPIAISEIADPDVIRVKLLASGRDVHAPMMAVAGSSIHGATTKTTPVDADEFGYWDSVGLQAVKTTWANLKATIWTALGALINGGTGKTTPVDADMFAIADSAASNATKKLTWANLKATMIAALGTAATVNTGTTTGTVPLNAVGTFTPIFISTGATFSYASQVGRYVQIGKVVYFWWDVVLNTSGNTLSANALTLGGLPFTINTNGGQGIFPVRWTQSTMSYVALTVRLLGNSTTMVLESITAAATGNTNVPLSNAALHATNGSSMRVVGFYEV